MSSPHKFDRRQFIREKWGSQLISLRGDVRLVFMLGRYTKDRKIPHHHPPKNSNGKPVPEEVIVPKIEEESRVHGDLIIEDFLDTYLNLTMKTSFAIKWALHNCNTSKFVFKVDDDVFVHPENLNSLLQTIKLRSKPVVINNKETKLDVALVGKKYVKVKPNRGKRSPYFLPPTFYEKRILPNFSDGFAYIFTGNLLQALFDCILETPFIPGEDVFLTGLCFTRHLKLRITNHDGFRREKRLYPLQLNQTCTLKTAVAAHTFVTDLREYYKILEDGHTCT